LEKAILSDRRTVPEKMEDTNRFMGRPLILWMHKTVKEKRLSSEKEDSGRKKEWDSQREVNQGVI